MPPHMPHPNAPQPRLTPVAGAGPTYEATFATWREAQAAAEALMPRRKHNRPYPQRSGYHSARAPHGADRWIVMVGNAVLMESGGMFDYQQNRFITRGPKPEGALPPVFK